jgi:hypothetical protein
MDKWIRRSGNGGSSNGRRVLIRNFGEALGPKGGTYGT